MSEERSTVSVRGLGELDAAMYRRWVEAALIITAVGYGAVFAATLLFTPDESIYALGPSIVVLVSLGSLAFTRTGHLRSAVFVCLLAIWIEQVSTIPVRGILGDYGVVGLPVLVLGVGIVFGRRAAFALAGLSVAVTTGGAIFAHVARGVPTTNVGEEGFLLVVTGAAMFATAALVSVAMRAFASVLDKARASERRSADMIAHAPDGILVLDAGEGVVAANPAAEGILGCPEPELIGRTLGVILSGMKAETDWANLSDLSSPSEGGLPTLVWWPVGHRTHWCEVTARAFANGEEVGKQVMLRDVSIRQNAIQEQRRVRDRLEEAQRLEAVGRLAGGIAHDFRNLLTVVSTSAELIREETEGEASRLAEDIREASARASDLTGQLLTFARREIVQIEAVALPEVVQFMEVGIQQVLGAGVKLQLMLEADVPKVFADRSQLEQILFNLTKNAADAMGGEGSLEISLVGPGGSSKGRIGTFREVPAGFVEIRVSDDGPGMDAEVLERAFEPFFTTKPTGEATGLGLSSVHGIVSQNGGQVGIESRIGEGTSVQVLWPVDTRPPNAAETL